MEVGPKIQAGQIQDPGGGRSKIGGQRSKIQAGAGLMSGETPHFLVHR